ncbi:DUF3152 domain-containing protein [Corynebacterium casei]|uniref:DUF3152 domain-containing protein n=1 Tax=Corynebacterium casei TaxID=160386 RepID=UPI0026477871|nr:DUF3152 domain-containing protein [Corynebacterium casei]MDN5728875.1 DUF3152 domain-containing protein [Corynebacterium casei]MDN6156228.1 DUF3152 domain-containing protein [Corynebacterium casei]
MDSSRQNSDHAPERLESNPIVRHIVRFAEEFGWWRVVAIPILAVITVWVLVDILIAKPVDGSEPELSDVPVTTSQQATTGEEDPEATGPDPAEVSAAMAAVTDNLPAGGAYSEGGNGTFRPVGTPGQDVGEGDEIIIRYSIEVENGINTIPYGGDTAFATMVDATLADPRGWTEDDRFKFVHVPADSNPDTRIQLTSLSTAAELCGAELAMETSCHTRITGESTVLLNEARWVRGAVPFEGDLGNYRQYLINHEFGHAIGYADHQACGGDDQLAPVMMQQTLSLNNAQLHEMSPEEVYPDEDVTCNPNPWPYPQAN